MLYPLKFERGFSYYHSPHQIVGDAAIGGAGTVNTGGGGGGGGSNAAANYAGGAGGSGVVIVAYKTDGSTGVSTDSTGGTITTSGAYTLHTFTASDTFTAVLTAAAAAPKNFASPTIWWGEW